MDRRISAVALQPPRMRAISGWPLAFWMVVTDRPGLWLGKPGLM